MKKLNRHQIRAVLIRAIFSVLLLSSMGSYSIAAEVMPNDPVLPPGNLPTAQRQTPVTPPAANPPNTAAPKPTGNNTNAGSLNREKSGVDNPNSRNSKPVSNQNNVIIVPQIGNRNGSPTGNGVGLGPGSVEIIDPNKTVK